MCNVILSSQRLYEHVINVNFHGFFETLGEHLIDEPLVRHSFLFDPKGYYFVAIDALIYYECSLLLVIKMHQDLVITRECIYEY